MLLMTLMGLLLVAGVALTTLWSASPYRPWEPADLHGRNPKAVSLWYLRGVALALVGGFWAGALVTGPAMRLIMRLLAVTAGDDAQGRITEAEEVIGSIDLDGTIGLYIFGGILPGLLSGAIYLLVRRWLPPGRMAGVVFGLLHLVIAATRVDPLRPGNPDFDLVGPGWLSVTTFGLAAVLHGMAVVAFANRFSAAFPSRTREEAPRAAVPLVLPVLLLIPGVFLLVPILAGLAIALGAALVAGDLPRRIVRSRGFLVAGRVVIGIVTLVLLPGAVLDLRDVIVR